MNCVKTAPKCPYIHIHIYTRIHTHLLEQLWSGHKEQDALQQLPQCGLGGHGGWQLRVGPQDFDRHWVHALHRFVQETW